MKRVLLSGFIALFSADLALAEPQTVMRYTDEDGNTVFTDQVPAEITQPDTVTIETDKSFVLPPPSQNSPLLESSSTETAEPPVHQTYSTFEFSMPTNEASFRSNEGIIQYALSIQPRIHYKHQLTITIDGEPVDNTSPSGTIRDIDRGEHTILATIIDKKSGATIKSTPPVVFYMLKHSVLNQKRTPPPRPRN